MKACGPLTQEPIYHAQVSIISLQQTWVYGSHIIMLNRWGRRCFCAPFRVNKLATESIPSWLNSCGTKRLNGKRKRRLYGYYLFAGRETSLFGKMILPLIRRTNADEYLLVNSGNILPHVYK